MKKLKGLLAAALSVMLLAACSSEETSSGVESEAGIYSDTNISVVLKTLSSPYWRYVEAGAKKAGEDLGIHVTVVGPSSEAQLLEQVNMLEDQITKKPGALLVSPSQPDAVINVLEDASEKDIPVLLVDTDTNFKGKVSFIGIDNHTAGYEGGKALAAMLHSGDKVALISGVLGNPATDDRINGAKEALEEAGMEIVAEQPADSDKSEAMSVMENILEKNGDIKGIFAANDDMAIGTLRAVQAKKLDVKIFGVDGTEEAVQSILNGGLTGTVAQNPYNMGYEGVSNALKAMNGETVEETIDSGIEIVTDDSAQEFLEFLQSISN